MNKIPLTAGIIIAVMFLYIFVIRPNDKSYSTSQLCRAIFLAEGGYKAKYLYGIKSVRYRDIADAQMICHKTIKHARKDFRWWHGNFISFLGKRYCPENTDVWVKNVRWRLEHEK